MKGLLIEDTGIVKMMDSSLENEYGTSELLPVEIKKRTVLSANVHPSRRLPVGNSCAAW